MKKLLLISSIIAFAFSVSAQHTTPRYGTAPNQNKTFSSVGFANITLADTAGETTDTVLINPNSYCSNVVLTLTDSCVLAFSSVASSYFGDNFTITIQNASGSGHFVNFLGYSGLATKWGMGVTGTKISPASALSATLRFQFDGAKWNECSRVIR